MSQPLNTTRLSPLTCQTPVICFSKLTLNHPNHRTFTRYLFSIYNGVRERECRESEQHIVIYSSSKKKVTPVFSLFIPKDLQHLSRRLYSLSSYHCVELHAAIIEELRADCVRLRCMTNTVARAGGGRCILDGAAA